MYSRFCYRNKKRTPDHTDTTKQHTFHKTGVRHYDPNTGVFASPDPFKGYLEDPQSQHPYMYCRGNPVRYSDPSGYDVSRKQWEDLFKRVGVVSICAGVAIAYVAPPLQIKAAGGAIAIAGVVSVAGSATFATAITASNTASTTSHHMSSRKSDGGGGGSSRKYNWTEHGDTRRGQVGFTREEIEEALNSSKYKRYPGQKPGTEMIMYKGRGVIYDKDTYNIITILRNAR